ncbi:hypothetical protein JCM10212_006698 [Sporobolomyces blumeae]
MGEAPRVERWDEGLELYRHDALRKTRTPGRVVSNEPNCVNLSDLVRPASMLGMYTHTYCLEFDFLATMLPILDHPHAARDVPLFIGQDIKMDPLLSLACSRAGIDVSSRSNHLTMVQETIVAPVLTKLYHELVGSNYHAIHPKCPGCAHSKVFVVKYPGWLLVAITSANTMRLDMELCDNLWYIQSFPETTASSSFRPSRVRSEFEQILLYHLNELECPDHFLSTITSRSYDYSLAHDDSVRLVVSHPGTVDPEWFDRLAIGRLGAIARGWIADNERDKVELEFCCASVGLLGDGWVQGVDRLLRGFEFCAKEEKKKEPRGGTDRSAGSQGEATGVGTRDWTIVYPAKRQVHEECPSEVRESAVNLSCKYNTSTWDSTRDTIKRMFHLYEAKEPGRLFHQKTILWTVRPGSTPSSSSSSSSPDHCPTPSRDPQLKMLYLGSHNLSKAAWGSPGYSSETKRGQSKVRSVANFELGVCIRGSKVLDLLERGSPSTWDDVVTWKRPAEQYREGDVPWVSSWWARQGNHSLEG